MTEINGNDGILLELGLDLNQHGMRMSKSVWQEMSLNILNKIFMQCKCAI